jgi:hypothetical protein
LRLPPTAVVIASGVLIDGGRKALTAAAALGSAHEVWVRNGLGQISAAKVARGTDDMSLAELHLTRSIAVPAPTLPPRDAFPGSPGFAVEFPAIANAATGWPLLRVGFLGRPASVAGVYQLGITMPQANRGGPVFDASGRLAGIAISNAAGDRMVLASHLRQYMSDASGEQVQAAQPVQPITSERMAVDEIYERALKITVQVIVER